MNNEEQIQNIPPRDSNTIENELNLEINIQSNENLNVNLNTDSVPESVEHVEITDQTVESKENSINTNLLPILQSFKNLFKNVKTHLAENNIQYNLKLDFDQINDSNILTENFPNILIDYLSSLNEDLINILNSLTTEIKVLNTNNAENQKIYENLKSFKNIIYELKTEFNQFNNLMQNDLKIFQKNLTSSNSINEIQMIELHQILPQIYEQLLHNTKKIYHHQKQINLYESESKQQYENQLNSYKTQITNYMSQITKLKLALKAARVENNDLSKQITSIKSNEETSNQKFLNAKNEMDSINQNFANMIEENKILKESLKNSTILHDQIVEQHQMDLNYVKRDLELSLEKYNALQQEFTEYSKIQPITLPLNYSNSPEIEAERQRHLLQINEITEKFENSKKRIQELETLNNDLTQSFQKKEKIHTDTKITLNNMEQNYKDKYMLLERTLNEKLSSYISQVTNLTETCGALKQQLSEANALKNDTGFKECAKSVEPQPIDRNSNEGGLESRTNELPKPNKKNKIKFANILENYSTDDVNKIVSNVVDDPNSIDDQSIMESLNEYENENSLLKEQIALLKDEIRKIERTSKRQETLSNVECLKDTFISFLLSSPKDKENKLPLIVNLLQPDREELNKLALFASLRLNEGSSSMLPGIVSSVANYIGKWR